MNTDLENEMFDRTDLQLMLCEQIKELSTDELAALYTRLTGQDLTLYSEEKEIVIGAVEALAIDDEPALGEWLGFMKYALGERLARQGPVE